MFIRFLCFIDAITLRHRCVDYFCSGVLSSLFFSISVFLFFVFIHRCNTFRETWGMVSETMGAVPIERFMAGHSRSLSIKEKIGEESKKNTSANPISEKKKRKTKQSCLLKDSQLDFRLLKIIKIYLQFTVTRTSKQKGI